MPTFLMFTLKTQWCLNVHAHAVSCVPWCLNVPVVSAHGMCAVSCHMTSATFSETWSSSCSYFAMHVIHMWPMCAPAVHPCVCRHDVPCMWCTCESCLCTCDAHVLALSSWRLKLQASIYIKWPAESLDVARRSGMTLWSLPTCIQSPSWRPRRGYQQIKRL